MATFAPQNSDQLLNSAKSSLMTDEVYHVLSKYDQKLDGKLHQKSFLEETCKPQPAPEALNLHQV